MPKKHVNYENIERKGLTDREFTCMSLLYEKGLHEFTWEGITLEIRENGSLWDLK